MVGPPTWKILYSQIGSFPQKKWGERKNILIYELPPARYLECFEPNLDLYVMMDALAAQHMTQSFNALALPRTHKFGTQKLSSKEKVHSSSPNFEKHHVYADISPYIYIYIYNHTYVFSILNLGQDFFKQPSFYIFKFGPNKHHSYFPSSASSATSSTTLKLPPELRSVRWDPGWAPNKRFISKLAKDAWTTCCTSQVTRHRDVMSKNTQKT